MEYDIIKASKKIGEKKMTKSAIKHHSSTQQMSPLTVKFKLSIPVPVSVSLSIPVPFSIAAMLPRALSFFARKAAMSFSRRPVVTTRGRHFV